MAATPPASVRMRVTSHEPVHADALQADGVDHAGRRLDNARGRVALALGEEEALDADAPEGRQVGDVFILEAIAEAAAGRDERIRQLERADADGKVACHQSHTISAPSKTGPEMHERT